MQTFTRFGEPFTTARTRWMFGFQRRLVRRCEWLSFMPKIGFLPHTSQTEDIAEHLDENVVRQDREEPARSREASRPRRTAHVAWLCPDADADELSAPPTCARPCCGSATPLRAHQEELNRLNVYPVPDGDTGTNMALTLESVSAELAHRDVDGRGVPRASAAAR